jgi:hypothetical protein
LSTFRHKFELILDGEDFEITTSAGDQLKAEEALGREKKDITVSPIALQLRVAFYAFSRTFPEHVLARNWAKFSEVFDDMNDLEPEEGNALDPTHVVESES